MQTVTIKASNRVNGKNVLAGEREEIKPETFQEALEVYGSEAVILEKAWQSHVIDVQASIRNGGDSKTAKMKRLLAKIQAEPDGELAQLAERLGFTL